MNILMIGVDKNRIGGMWSVAETFIESQEFNNQVKLYYVATSTCGSISKRVCKMLSGYIKIIWLLFTKKIDIVHIHMAERGSVYRKGFVIKVAKKFGKKVIVQMHAGPIMAWYETLCDSNKRKVKGILNEPDKLLVLGEYWKKRLLPLIKSEKMAVLYNGVKCQKINPYNTDGKYILYLGLIKKTKGVYDLVDAISKIEKQLPQDVKVYLCGKDEECHIGQYIIERGLKDKVIFLGWISREQRDKLFENTIMVVLPSYYEALSMTVIEAMSNGIPVITTNISTMSELLGEDINLVEPGDVDALAKEILSVYNNKELRVRESEIEYQRVLNRFSIECNIQSVLNVYRQILGT